MQRILAIRKRKHIRRRPVNHGAVAKKSPIDTAAVYMKQRRLGPFDTIDRLTPKQQKRVRLKANKLHGEIHA